VEQFGGVPPYYETRAYVARVVRDFNQKKAAQEKAAASASKKTSVVEHANTKSQGSAGKSQHPTVAEANASPVR